MMIRIKSIGGENVQVPEWIVFCDDEVDMPCGSLPWKPLAALMRSYPELSADKKNFEDEVTKNIRKLLQAKIKDGSSKFSESISSSDQLHATLTDEGAVVVTDSGGKEIYKCFQAAGEQLVLYLAINAAVRKLLHLDVPFVVVDCEFHRLDQLLLRSCYDFVLGMSNRTIFLRAEPPPISADN